jgi:hypothetical protein
MKDKNENQMSIDLIDKLFEGVLKPFHSKNARMIFEVFCQNKEYTYITTYDIELKLKKKGTSITKKEINSWLVSLSEASLISKTAERGRPMMSNYDDRYTFDLWHLTDTGLLVAERLPILMAKKELFKILHLSDFTLSLLNELEDLYLASKILFTLYDRGGSLSYVELGKHLAIDREKLAVFFRPDASHSEKPLFNITVKPPNFKANVFKLFGWVQEQNLILNLTDEGYRRANEIILKETEN